MKHYIVRRQLTPPGTDKVVEVIHGDDKKQIFDRVVALAREETESRNDVTSIAHDPDRKDGKAIATLMGCPDNDSRKYSRHSSIASYEAIDGTDKYATLKVVVRFPKGITDKEAFDDWMRTLDKLVTPLGVVPSSSELISTHDECPD